MVSTISFTVYLHPRGHVRMHEQVAGAVAGATSVFLVEDMHPVPDERRAIKVSRKVWRPEVEPIWLASGFIDMGSLTVPLVDGKPAVGHWLDDLHKGLRTGRLPCRRYGEDGADLPLLWKVTHAVRGRLGLPPPEPRSKRWSGPQYELSSAARKLMESIEEPVPVPLRPLSTQSKVRMYPFDAYAHEDGSFRVHNAGGYPGCQLLIVTASRTPRRVSWELKKLPEQGAQLHELLCDEFDPAQWLAVGYQHVGLLRLPHRWMNDESGRISGLLERVDHAVEHGEWRPYNRPPHEVVNCGFEEALANRWRRERDLPEVETEIDPPRTVREALLRDTERPTALRYGF